MFQLDEFGHARESASSFAAPDLIDKAYIARANCPEEAIILTERPKPVP
ncbi:hypothetical protein [Bradyrhizobium icense]|nr:hypothetical protein [Bradyrhizobium icense]